jgi:DNA-directed RNA polymerase specialized sigma24 family protein
MTEGERGEIKQQALHRLRIGAKGIAAMEEAIEAPVRAHGRADRQRQERSREQMRAALDDARVNQRRLMRQAREQGASEAEIAQAVGMTKEQVHRTMQ